MSRFIRSKPTIEGLEDRLVPTNFGVPWPDSRHLTLSFAPDGTQVGHLRSELFRVLDGSFGDRSWQREILRAAQTWAVQANLNIGLVPDDGRDFGARGPYQGAEGVGDIRISAVPMPPDVFAFGSPFDLLAGTWSGDVRLNSSYEFGLGASGGRADLFSVVMQELGHALGLDNNAEDPASLMNDTYGVRTDLAASDVAALRDLYGEREADEFDEASVTGNETFAKATQLNLGNKDFLSVEGDLTTQADVDTYEVRPGKGLASLTVRLKTAGLSLLVPRLTVYDRFQNLVSTVAAPDISGEDLTVTLTGLKPNDSYFIRVERAVDGLFAVGSYRLGVELEPEPNRGGGNTPNVVSSVASALLNDDGHTNDTLATATKLKQKVLQIDPRWDYVYQASLSDAVDVDYYRVIAPGFLSDGTATMTVSLWGTVPGLGMRARAYDELGQPVSADVIVNDEGKFTLQVPNARAGQPYILRVQGAAGNTVTAGNYTVAVDFGFRTVTLPTLATGTLSADQPQAQATLSVPESQIVHLLFGTPSSGHQGPFSLLAKDGTRTVETLRLAEEDQAVSATVFFTPGQYTLQFVAELGQALAPFAYWLRATSLSDTIGPQLADTTQAPAGTGPGLVSSPSGPTQPAAPPLLVSVQQAYSDPIQPVQPAQVAKTSPAPENSPAPVATGLVTRSPALIVVAAPSAVGSSTLQTTSAPQPYLPGASTTLVRALPAPPALPENTPLPIPAAGREISVVPLLVVPRGAREGVTASVSAGLATRPDTLIPTSGIPRPEVVPSIQVATDRMPLTTGPSDGAGPSGNRPASPSADTPRSLPTPASAEGDLSKRPGDTTRNNPGKPVVAPYERATAPDSVPAPRNTTPTKTRPQSEGTAPSPETSTAPPAEAPRDPDANGSNSSGEAEVTPRTSFWRAILALLAAPMGLWAIQPGWGGVARRTLKQEDAARNV